MGVDFSASLAVGYRTTVSHLWRYGKTPRCLRHGAQGGKFCAECGSPVELRLEPTEILVRLASDVGVEVNEDLASEIVPSRYDGRKIGAWVMSDEYERSRWNPGDVAIVGLLVASTGSHRQSDGPPMACVPVAEMQALAATLAQARDRYELRGEPELIVIANVSV